MSFDVVVECGPLRKKGKNLAFCTGVLIDIAPSNQNNCFPGTGDLVEVVFKVIVDGLTVQDIAKISARLPRHRDHTNADHTELASREAACQPSLGYISSGIVLRATASIETELSVRGTATLRVIDVKDLSAEAAKVPQPPSDARMPVAKAERHACFADWALDTFSTAGLADGVLDVAGGKGRLSNAFAARGVPSTLIDPCAGTGCTPSLKHCCACVHLEDEDPAEPLQQSIRCIRKTLETAMADDPAILEGCGAVLAMHPDEATEGSVDVALAAGRQFAVVPCCVFPHLFPHRKLRNGSAVVKLGSFIRYLREKDSRIRMARLGFAGCNTVVFMTAMDFEAEPRRRTSRGTPMLTC